MGVQRIIRAGVIKKCFYRVEHKMVMELRIADTKFLDLIQRFLTNPILASDSTDYTNNEKEGHPTGRGWSCHPY